MESKIYAPYGFYLLKSDSNYAIFKNKFCLPVAYLYSNTFSERQLLHKDPLTIENIMLNCAIVEDKYNLFENNFKPQQDEEIRYKIGNFNNIVIRNNEIEVLDENNYCDLIFNPVDIIDKEVFVVVNGIKLENCKDYAFMSIENKTNLHSIYKKARISNNMYAWHVDMNSIVFNLGLNNIDTYRFRLSFDKKCNLKYKNIKIVARNNEVYQNSILNIKQNLPFDIFFKNDELCLKINSPSNKILQFSIPFSKGWEGYIDNQKTNLFRSNIMYTAMFVDEGLHKIKLVYHTPYLKCGITISLVTFIFVMMFVCLKYIIYKKCFNSHSDAFKYTKNV